MLRVSEMPMAAQNITSSQERADGIEGCEIVIHCGSIALL